ncbi:MAG: tol-pal system protein YbgF [Desulfobacterales bacterium]|nr:tol-pal system protein YbgF [Desulfobacterales bacterium]
MKNIPVYLVLVLSIFTLTSCVALQHNIKKENEQLEARLSQSLTDTEKRLHQADQDFEVQITALKNNIEELVEVIAKMQVQLDEYEKSIGSFSAAKHKTVPAAPKAQPAPPVLQMLTPDEIYQNGLNAYNENDYKKAYSHFTLFVKNNPRHVNADNALYWAGECQYARKSYKSAITTFKSVVIKYPDGNKVPDAILKTGYAYLSLNDRNSAQQQFKNLIKRYPFSPASESAEKMLKKIN